MIGHVVLPLRTRSTLNQREHWARRAKRNKRERQVTRLALLGESAIVETVNRVVGLSLGQNGCRVLLKRIAPRRLDDDNLRGALKAVRDEVAAFLGVDDGDARVQWEYAQGKGEPRQYAVIIAFEEAATETPQPQKGVAAS